MVLLALQPIIPRISDFGKFRKEFGKISETDWKYLDVCGKIRKLYAIKSG